MVRIGYFRTLAVFQNSARRSTFANAAFAGQDAFKCYLGVPVSGGSCFGALTRGMLLSFGSLVSASVAWKHPLRRAGELESSQPPNKTQISSGYPLVLIWSFFVAGGSVVLGSMKTAPQKQARSDPKLRTKVSNHGAVHYGRNLKNQDHGPILLIDVGHHMFRRCLNIVLVLFCFCML